MAAREKPQGIQPGQLQTQARPIFTPAMPDASNKWAGLSDVFAGAEVWARKQQEERDKEQAAAATRWANSQTVDGLEKEIRSGNLERAKSPVFVATVQSIWGTNAQAAWQRDVTNKINTGELKFTDEAELDRYMVENRNTMLAGHSNYAAAAFDKGFQPGRAVFQEAMAKQRDKKAVEQAGVQATDFLANTLNSVTIPGYTGTPQEAAKVLIGTYGNLSKTLVLPDGVLEGALRDTLTRAADSGKKELLESLLDAELPQGGTLRSTLGAADSVKLVGHANAKQEEINRNGVHEDVKPWYQQAGDGRMDEAAWREWTGDPKRAKYMSASTIEELVNRNRAAQARKMREAEEAALKAASDQSIATAQASVNALLDNGKVWALNGREPQVMTPNGKVTNFDWQGYATQALTKQTEGLPVAQAAAKWAYNNLPNPQWKALLDAGMSNISSIGTTTNGKPSGGINETTTQAIEVFRQLNREQPAYLKDMMGNASYERYTDLDLMVTKWGKTPDEAALLLSNADKAMVVGGDARVKDAEVRAEANNLLSNPWYKPDWAARWLMGENTTGNSAGVSSGLSRYASLLVRSGMYPDAKSALAASVEYFSDPKVSARINGTRYLRAELPTPPGPAESQDEWFDRWITAVPKKMATKAGFKENETRVEYSESARGYTVFVNNTMLLNKDGQVEVFPRSQIQKWYAEEHQRIIDGLVKNHADPVTQGTLFKGTPAPMSGAGRRAALGVSPQ